MIIRDLVDAMQRIAPLEYAESWDNVGLLVGEADRALTGPILLTIDLTEPVLDEAIGIGASAIIAYHPPIWDALLTITGLTPKQRIIYRAIEAGLAIHSPHTALDAAPDGVTDWLCEGISGGVGTIKGDCRALIPHEHHHPQRRVKIVTFTPEHEVDPLRKALASAGAGYIGKYRACSFMVKGIGTFMGSEGAKPAVGEPGRLERVEECRLEMVCSKAALPIVLETLRRFHPYEEPAIDIHERMAEPQRYTGMGRRLTLDQPVTIAKLTERIKAFLDAKAVRVAAVNDVNKPICRIGVCPGAGAPLVPLAVESECELFLTGEMKHHDVLAATNAGMSILVAGHTHTERGYLPRLALRLREQLPEAETHVSTRDQSPLVTY